MKLHREALSGALRVIGFYITVVQCGLQTRAPYEEKGTEMIGPSFRYGVGKQTGGHGKKTEKPKG